MRRLLIPATMLLVAGWMACSPRTKPTVTTVPEAPVPEKVETIKETAADREMAATLEAGKVVYNGKCTRCHAPKPIDNWNTEEWKPILKSMIRKSKLDSVESMQVTAYVNANCKK